MTEENTFAQMEQENKEVPNTVASNAELDLTQYANVAPSDKISYTRPNLDGKEDIITNFQVFGVSENDKPSKGAKAQYYNVKTKITYASVNDDGIHNYENISGVKQFVQKDGSLSAPQFWYSGGTSQSNLLWETVAKSKGVEPKDLLFGDFIALLSSKPKVKIMAKEYDNWNPETQRKEGTVKKNMPAEFL
jgi:hypothetical protein